LPVCSTLIAPSHEIPNDVGLTPLGRIVSGYIATFPDAWITGVELKKDSSEKSEEDWIAKYLINNPWFERDPPFEHGGTKFSFSQNSPSKSDWHKHETEIDPTTHVAPFKHGFDEQSVIPIYD